MRFKCKILTFSGDKILPLVALTFTLLFAQDVSWFNKNINTFTLSTEDELKGLQSLIANNTNNFYGKTVKLANNIALTGTWTPIGDDNRPFQGIFDGQGYSISGLSVSGGDYAGLFGYVGVNGQIKNINVLAKKIITSTDGTEKKNRYAGGLAAVYVSTKPIENSSVKADSINAYSAGVVARSGGLVGSANNITIIGSYANVAVFSKVVNTSEQVSAEAGGLIGSANSIIINNSYASGSVLSSAYGSSYYTNSGRSGGLAGSIRNTAKANSIITNSYASNDISTTYSNTGAVGDIVGDKLNSASLSMKSVYSSRSSSTADMKQKDFYLNWDFDYIWDINEGVGYPYFKRDIADGKIPQVVELSIADSAKTGTTAELTATASSGLPVSYVSSDPCVAAIENGKLIFKNVGTVDITAIQSGDSAYKSVAISKTINVSLGSSSSQQVCFLPNIAWYADNPNASMFEISTREQLEMFATLVNDTSVSFSGKTIRLKNNIKLTKDWIPIGNSNKPFQGLFDGRDYTISGLSVNSGSYYAGLFGYVGVNGQIKNVNVVGKNIKTALVSGIGKKYVGGLVGYYGSAKAIENCNVQADSIYNESYSSNTGQTLLSDSVFAGGLVGYAGQSMTIYKSYTNARVSSGAYGSPGDPGQSSYNLNGSKGSDGVGYAGGLVGYAKETIKISNSYAKGDVHAYGRGGDGGNTAFNIIGNCPMGNGGRGGNGYGYAGGIIGYANASTNILNSYASGIVTATANRGLGGKSLYAGCEYTYAADGNAYTYNGGISGRWANVENAATSVYYKQQTTSQSGTSPTGITALSDEDMKKQESFVDWDFDGIWDIVEDSNYPYFRESVHLYEIEIEPVSSKEYTGEKIMPKPIIHLKNLTPLIENSDYDLSYGENINVGSGVITIIGKGIYSSFQETITFTIEPKKLEENAIQAIAEQIYTRTAITPEIVVKDGSTTLVKGVDYTLSFNSNTNAGTASVSVSGKGNYTGTATANFQISAKSMSDLQITALDQSYTGSATTLTVTIKHGATTLKNTDYTLTFSSIDVGTVTVAAIGKGNYCDTITTEFAIIAKALGTGMVATIPTQIYTGNAIEPAIEIKNNGTVLLVVGTDYDVKYENNVAVGTAMAIVTGKGNYIGEINITFEIESPFPSSSSAEATPSSSSMAATPSSSSTATMMSSSSNESQIPSSSSAEATPSSSSMAATPSSSSTATISSSSNGTTPIRQPQTAILLSNLPQGTKVEVYNLQGKRIYSTHSENSQILKILVQTGVYIVKTGTKTTKVVVR